MDSINKDIEEMIYITCLGVDITIGGVHRQVIIMDSSYRAAGLVHDVRGNWKQAASVGGSNLNFFQNWRTLCMSKFG